MKIAINVKYGGVFMLSQKAVDLFNQKEGTNIPVELTSCDKIRWRSNPSLIEIIKELGYEANGALATIAVIDVPDGFSNNIYIDNHRGVEAVHEYHNIWEYEYDSDEE